MNTTSTSDPTRRRTVSDVLGLGRIGDEEWGIAPEFLRQLYAHARGEDHSRKLFANDPKFVRGWLDANAEATFALLSSCLPLDDDRGFKDARRIAKVNLEALAWNDILEIEEPPIQCQVSIHGNRWGIRFRDATPTMRGHERLNEELPPAGSSQTATPQENGSQNIPDAGPPADDLSGAADVLRAGGMPT